MRGYAQDSYILSVMDAFAVSGKGGSTSRERCIAAGRLRSVTRHARIEGEAKRHGGGSESHGSFLLKCAFAPAV